VRSPATGLALFLALSSSAATALGAEPARPVRKPPLAAALLCSVATAMIPLGLGAAHAATATTDAGKNLGLEVAGVGTALAPIVGHIVLGEWKRAAAFGVAPVVGEIGLIAYMTKSPSATFHGSDAALALFATFFLTNLLGSAVGMTDVVMVNERTALPRVTVAPMALGGRYGLTIGGSL
jgi:hypothetical protein